MFIISYILIIMIMLLLSTIYLTKNIRENYDWNMTGSTGTSVLNINYDTRTLADAKSSHPTDKALYVTKNTTGTDRDGIAEFRHSNGSQGIGIGFSSIYATGGNDDQNITILPKGNGGTNLYGSTYLRGSVFNTDVNSRHTNKGMGFCTRYIRKLSSTGGMLYVTRNQPGYGAILIKINAVGTFNNAPGALLNGVVAFSSSGTTDSSTIGQWNSFIGSTNMISVSTNVDGNSKKGGLYFNQANNVLLIDMEIMIGGNATWDIDVWTDSNTVVY